MELLRRFLTERGRIRDRVATGTCARHQRDVQIAVKTAREVALLPYAQRTVLDRQPARRGRVAAVPPTGQTDRDTAAPSDASGSPHQEESS